MDDHITSKYKYLYYTSNNCKKNGVFSKYNMYRAKFKIQRYYKQLKCFKAKISFAGYVKYEISLL